MTRFGQYRPLDGTPAQAGRLLTPDIIGLHTMAGTLAGTDAFFQRNGYGGTFSHFGVGGAGQCYQWQDTELRGAANLNGNHRIISIETADTGETFPKWWGEDVPAWTGLQLDTLAQLIAHLCREHGIPCQLIPDSRPGRRGIAPHRLGINPWRVPLGELWSSATSKVCPGERRLAQLPELLARTQALLNPPPPVPARPTFRTHDAMEDAMYIKCQPDPKGPVWVALLSGPIFVGLGATEIQSAESEIARGAAVQWVGRATWDELDRRSHALCDLPRPVTITAPRL